VADDHGQVTHLSAGESTYAILVAQIVESAAIGIGGILVIHDISSVRGLPDDDSSIRNPGQARASRLIMTPQTPEAHSRRVRPVRHPTVPTRQGKLVWGTILPGLPFFSKGDSALFSLGRPRGSRVCQNCSLARPTRRTPQLNATTRPLELSRCHRLVGVDRLVQADSRDLWAK
jgi:hypothetical protein